VALETHIQKFCIEGDNLSKKRFSYSMTGRSLLSVRSTGIRNGNHGIITGLVLMNGVKKV
jgi:hypothetical protein